MYRSHRVLIAALVALIALVAIPLALGDQSYTDPAGDAKTGADITGVAVSNDAAGVLTFRVTTVAPINTLTDVYVDLDTDANPATGLFGSEYSLHGYLGGFGLLKASGTTFADTPAPSLSMSITGNVVEFKIGRQDIGNVSRFGFDAATVLYNTSDNYVSEDDAPDGGSFIYTLAFSQCSNGKDDDGDGKVDAADLGCSSSTDNLESDDPVTLKAGKAKVVPAKPMVGKLVVVSAAGDARRDGPRCHVGHGEVRCSGRHRVGPGQGQGRGRPRLLRVQDAGEVQRQDRPRNDHRHGPRQVQRDPVLVQGRVSAGRRLSAGLIDPASTHSTGSGRHLRRLAAGLVLGCLLAAPFLLQQRQASAAPAAPLARQDTLARQGSVGAAQPAARHATRVSLIGGPVLRGPARPSTSTSRRRFPTQPPRRSVGRTSLPACRTATSCRR